MESLWLCTWFQLVSKEDIDVLNASLVSKRFVLLLKKSGTPPEKDKARLIAQGYEDVDKPYIVHESAALKHPSLQAILCFASITEPEIGTQDITEV